MASKSAIARWIRKKEALGVSKKDLYHSIGIFSNKTPERVMREKGLSREEYNKRHAFLFEVFQYLEK